ncbi:anaphase-promoting complex subunit 2 [Capronia coronata CBS 617.96]|uniref:Anaphase-promoting complex subunit 2 n=1 Tax=Capronia coronata CBS 617.96 TaxID=1182541 RepID=W9Z171_9EURO|nr:anaphase-promoting complex subunit 2 [Capronia coronata CBS 617.96]EXJ95326.1 anaphase-promoting complex subunit 2 [Capronia coronata CBS 617.96]
MAQVQIPAPLPAPGGVFASVFPPTGIKPPKHRQRFTPAATSKIPEIKRSLNSHLRSLLGIGDEGFFYGQNRHLPNLGGPFHSHFESSPPADQIRQPTAADHAAQNAREAESPLWTSLPRWRSVVGSETMKRLLAAVLNNQMTEYVTWSYAGVYRPNLHLHLDFWVTHLFARITQKALSSLRGGQSTLDVAESDLKKWKDMATARLGALRVDELFDIVVDWDATAPAIDDLRHFTTNPATRSYLTHHFSNVLQTRLLHPGASTINILQVYISIIRAFRILDPKGVLLDRVAKKIRRYLREREDTVKVIVAGLLSDPVGEDGHGQPSSPDPEILTDLAIELSKHDGQDGGGNDGEFDWNDMEWVPDPVDAAPDYMKSKNTDVIGSLITLFDSKDVLVKELQNTLAERLLKNKADFNQEIGVLEHLKIRLGDAALQGCEVMLRDVLDSRKVDNVIRKDQGMQDDKGRPRQDSDVQLHAKILSRLFWPTMPEQAFHVPKVVQDQQETYERGFESLKQSRKLTWLNAIGQVEVELELEDRVYQEEVLPWQAAVIYAFHDNSGEVKADEPVQTATVQKTKTITDLTAELAMSPTLVRSACIFWVSKRILIEVRRDTFAVLETLPDDDDVVMMGDDDTGRPGNRQKQQPHDSAAAAVAAEVAAAQAAKEAEEAERKQKIAMYHQFIVSMLTNQGAMPLPRIAMMLGIVVPGGFPFSNEELKEFLAGMIRDGVLEVGHGGAYKVSS